MTDPKDELGARFDERRADTERDEGTDQSSDTDNTSVSDNTDNTGNANDAGSKPGPDRDESATRHRRQVPMYLPDAKADELNKLYERLDGRSKVAGDGGIEKHADFMVALVDLAVEHEDELAERLGIEQESS
jgi:hypothetical protein